MRDKVKSDDFWTDRISRLGVRINKNVVWREDVNDDLERRIMAGDVVRSETFNTVSALYSSGAPIPDVTAAARDLLLDAYPRFIALCREDPDYALGSYGGAWDFRTRYLAFAVLARLSPEESRPLVEALDFWPERDAVWEHFIAALGHGEGREPVTSLVWPDAYASLLEALGPEGTDLTRLAALKTYDKGWLKEMRSATNPFYSNENNKNNTYVGYWNFEAAAATVIMDIDDHQLAVSRTYPKDWADWARMH